MKKLGQAFLPIFFYILISAIYTQQAYFHELATEWSKAENLSCVTVKLPAENIYIPGICDFIFQCLAWEGIVRYEVISTTSEFTVLGDYDQIDEAFKIIKNLKTP